jgi:hypothetical protein
MRTLRKKRKNRTQKQKRKSGGGFFTYPTYYMQKAVSMFNITPPVAYGNKANVKPFPYFQTK